MFHGNLFPGTILVMCRMLKKLGHEVYSAMSASEALEQIKREIFDLMISDIGLPDESGIELIKKVKKIQPNLKSVAVSGFGYQEDIERSLQSGFDKHLTKPIQMTDLQNVILSIAKDDNKKT